MSRPSGDTAGARRTSWPGRRAPCLPRVPPTVHGEDSRAREGPEGPVCQAGKRGETGRAAGIQESRQAPAPLGKRPAKGRPVTLRPAPHPVLGTAGAASPSPKRLRRRDEQRWSRSATGSVGTGGDRSLRALEQRSCSGCPSCFFLNKKMFKRNSYLALFLARGSCPTPTPITTCP